MKDFICTITPNAALDLGGTVKRLKPNEKSYVYNETRCPGGNGINVARILERLNVPVLATGFLGGSTGKEIKSLLDEEKVKSHFIQIDGDSRISVTVSNESDHKQTRLSFPGPTIKREEKMKLFSFVRKMGGISLLMLGGSLPAGFTTADIRCLMRIARKKKVQSVIDCPGKLMRDVISEGPLLIKPNLDEFHELTQVHKTTLGSIQKEATKLLDMVPFVCVSSVEGGTLLVTRQNSYFGRIPMVRIRSTVGAGDSMVGAMMASLFRGNFSGEELLRWGLAASAGTLSQPGTAMGSANEIKRLYKATFIKQVR